MVLHDSSECTNEALIGYAPISYFSIGLIEVLFSALVGVIVFNRNCFPSLSQSNVVTYVLPVYLSVVIPLLVICFLIGIQCLFGVYTSSKDILAIKWTILRFLSESLTIFLTHSGIGIISSRTSVFRGFAWSLFHSACVFTTLYAGGFHAMLYTVIVILVELVFVYGFLAFSPIKFYHRRPALYRFASISLLILVYQLAIVIAYLSSTNSYENMACAVELSFSITEFILICAIFVGFCEDSMFWQGLYKSHDINLNEPLLGIWDMNRRDVDLVAESVIHLERKVVTIIPFSHLRVDTSRYFSGGTARVYKGTYQSHEVAIKFLFCMELTPERIVSFCHEATMLNSLKHDNIVTCHGVAIMPPAISLVTEYCTWGSLFDFLHATDLVYNFDQRDEDEDDQVHPPLHSQSQDSYSYNAGFGNRQRTETNDTKYSTASDSTYNKDSSSALRTSLSSASQDILARLKDSANLFSYSSGSVVSGKIGSTAGDVPVRPILQLVSDNFAADDSTNVHDQEMTTPYHHLPSPGQEQHASTTITPTFTPISEASPVAQEAGGLTFMTAAETQSNAAEVESMFPRRQAMSVDRALTRAFSPMVPGTVQQQQQQQVHQAVALARYLDPNNNGEIVDPMDVASKLANAMAMSMSERTRQKKPSKKAQLTRKEVQSMPRRTRLESNTSSVSQQSGRQQSQSLQYPSVLSSVAATGLLNGNGSGALRRSITNNSESVEDSAERRQEEDLEARESSHHLSISISRSLLSKHYISQVIAPPTPSAQASTPGGGFFRIDWPPSTQPQQQPSHPTTPYPQPSVASAAGSAVKRRPGSILRGFASGFTPAGTASSSANPNNASNNNSHSQSFNNSGQLKLKSPASVLLTAEMGFGLGPAHGMIPPPPPSVSHSNMPGSRHTSPRLAAGVKKMPASSLTPKPQQSSGSIGFAANDQYYRKRRNTDASILTPSSSGSLADSEKKSKHNAKGAESKLVNLKHAKPPVPERTAAQLSEMAANSARLAGGGQRVSNRQSRSHSVRMSSSMSAGHYFLSNSMHTSIQSLGHLIPVSVRFAMIRDCAAGLAYLHFRGFMHCDIKSLNFLVTSQLTVKLADLGEARVIRRAVNLSRKNSKVPRRSTWQWQPRDSSFLGKSPDGVLNTDKLEDEDADEEKDVEAAFADDGSDEERSLPSNINWSSPETLQRSLLHDPQQQYNPLHLPSSSASTNMMVNESADVWSLAMVIYEILSGEVPFDTEDCRALTFAQFIQRLRDGLRPNIPPEYLRHVWLMELIQRAWAFEASDRCTAEYIASTVGAHVTPTRQSVTGTSSANPIIGRTPP